MSFDRDPIEDIEVIAKALGALKDEVVFVGGATVALYLPSKDFEPRPTEDVDCIVKISSKIELAKLEDSLRRLGFRNDPSLICRWQFEDLTVDIMPTDPTVLGFSNQWYKEAFDNSEEVELPQGTVVSIMSLPYFLATKLEAASDRGQHDLRISKDMEDIITLFKERGDIVRVIDQSPPKVRDFLLEKIKRLSEHPELDQIIMANVDLNDRASRQTVELRIREIASLSKKISR